MNMRGVGEAYSAPSPASWSCGARLGVSEDPMLMGWRKGGVRRLPPLPGGLRLPRDRARPGTNPGWGPGGLLGCRQSGRYPRRRATGWGSREAWLWGPGACGRGRGIAVAVRGPQTAVLVPEGAQVTVPAADSC